MIYVTDIAQNKIAELATDSKFFRVTAMVSDCSSMTYNTYFHKENEGEDVVHNFVGFSIVIDKDSLSYLNESKLDYIEGIGFVVDDSTSKGPCVCGKKSISSPSPFSPCLWK